VVDDVGRNAMKVIGRAVDVAPKMCLVTSTTVGTSGKKKR